MQQACTCYIDLRIEEIAAHKKKKESEPMECYMLHSCKPQPLTPASGIECLDYISLQTLHLPCFIMPLAQQHQKWLTPHGTDLQPDTATCPGVNQYQKPGALHTLHSQAVHHCCMR